MRPVRVLFVVLILLLGATMAVGVFGQGQTQPRLSDDDYYAIALSHPDVFRPSGPGSGRDVRPQRVERAPGVVTVDLTVDGIAFRVLIDPRTNEVVQVARR